MAMQLIELPTELVINYAMDNFGGISGLAAHLLSFSPAELAAYSLVPTGTEQGRALEFERGGLFSMSQTRQWLLGRLKTLSKQYGAGTFFVQDVWMKIDDHTKFIADLQTNMFCINSSPFFWAGHEAFSSKCIANTLAATRGFQILAAFSVHHLSKGQFENDFVIDEVKFNALLSGVKEYYMRAYDEESFLVLRELSRPTERVRGTVRNLVRGAG
jgi:hypothetical protein